jgi:hypothetical protein
LISAKRSVKKGKVKKSTKNRIPEPAKPATKTHNSTKVTPPKFAAVPASAPAEIGLKFSDEAALMSFLSPETMTKKILAQAHRLDTIVDLSKLNFEWNSRAIDKEHVGKLAESIRLRGIFEPILIAVDISNQNNLQVIRGHHRADAMHEIRRKAAAGEIKISQKKQVLPANIVFYAGREAYENDKIQGWADSASNIPELIARDSIFSRARYYSDIRDNLAQKKTGKVADSLGLSRSTIRDALNILLLPISISSLLKKNEKILREKFIYRISSRYSRVEKAYHKAQKDLAAANVGREPANYKAEYQRLLALPTTINELAKLQKSKEIELLAIVKVEIAYRKKKGAKPAGSVHGALLDLPIAKKAISLWLENLDPAKSYTLAELQKMVPKYIS